AAVQDAPARLERVAAGRAEGRGHGRVAEVDGRTRCTGGEQRQERRGNEKLAHASPHVIENLRPPKAREHDEHHGPTAVGEASLDMESEAPVSASADTPTSNSLPLTEPWQPAQTWSNIACGTPIEITSPGPNWCSSLIWKIVEPPLAKPR